MERRRFVQKLFKAFALGGVFLFAGCGKGKKQPGFGNQEGLWQLAEGQQKTEEPLELVYSKGTPALYRDASMGKADPNFKPKIGGG